MNRSGLEKRINDVKRSLPQRLWGLARKAAVPYALALSLATGLGCGAEFASRPQPERPQLQDTTPLDEGGIMNYDMKSKSPLDLGSDYPDSSSGSSLDGSLPDSSTTKIENMELKLSAGRYHTCHLRGDETVACWGYNYYGQSNPPSGTFVQVSAGYEHTCGLREDATIECWGNDEHGQSTPPEGIFTQVSVGYRQSCGLRENGEVECWGPYGNEQFDSPQETSLTQYSQISASGGAHTCALLRSGALGCCDWQPFMGDDHDPLLFAQISAGGHHTCGIGVGGEVECWRDNHDYREFSFLDGTISQISAGGFHTCGLKTDGTVECWEGRVNHEGEHGQSDPPTGTFTEVSAGGAHTCALDVDNNIQCWGLNDYGQCDPPE